MVQNLETMGNLIFHPCAKLVLPMKYNTDINNNAPNYGYQYIKQNVFIHFF